MVKRMIVESLGPIKKAEINLAKETIFLGKNNSGKTYISYLLYGVFQRFNNTKSEILHAYLEQKFQESKAHTSIVLGKQELSDYFINSITSIMNKTSKEDLSKIFNIAESEFKDCKIQFTKSDFQFLIQNAMVEKISGEYRRGSFIHKLAGVICIKEDSEKWHLELKDIEYINNDLEDTAKISTEKIIDFFKRIVLSVFSNDVFSIPSILYIPAERNGINVFRKELNIKRSSETFNVFEEENIQIAKYPLAIADYMKYLNIINMNIEEGIFERHKNNDREAIWLEFSEQILNGKYEYDEKFNEYYYREIQSIGNDKNIKYKKKRIPLQIASSSTKSLFGLEYYLKYRFTKGDILFIDEPEMNLDPSNQVRMASILTKLTNYGVKVIISTHSDYLVRATTNFLLESKIKNGDLTSDTVGYYFDKSEVKYLGDLSDVDYIENFDDENLDLEDNYLMLKNKLEEINHK